MENGVSHISQFGEVILFTAAGAIFITLTLFVSSLIRPHRPNADKLTTYESGEEPVGSAWTQFNVQFYIVALVFLLFEVEIVFLFPWSILVGKKELHTQTNGQWGWFAFIEAVLFIVVLGVGLAYAWVNGYLDWVKPKPQPTEFKSPVPRKLYENINQQYQYPADKKGEKE